MMMKKVYTALLIGLILFINPAMVHSEPPKLEGQVTAGSTENQFTIKVSNDTDSAIEGIRVDLVSSETLLFDFNILPMRIKRIEPDTSQVFTITFSVAEDIKKDSATIAEFQISAETGRLSSTQAILELSVSAPGPHSETAGQKVVTNTSPSTAGTEKISPYSYVLTKVTVKGLKSSDRYGAWQSKHKSGELGYVQKYHKGAYRKLDLLRCVDYPTQITLGEPIHFKFDKRTRWDSDEYQCDPTNSNDYWPPTINFGFGSASEFFEASATGKALHFPSCQELGIAGREKKSTTHVIRGDIVYDTTPWTQDEQVSLTADIRFVKDATDKESFHYNNPAFAYLATFATDGKLSKVVKEGKITVDYNNRLLKTPEFLMHNELTLGVNGLSLTYTLQVAGEPKPIAVTQIEVPAVFEDPHLSPLNTAAVETEPSVSGKTKADSGRSGGINPRDPDIATHIKDWLNRAEHPDNAKGARLRYDKWGRFHGTAANGGIITLNGTPDNLVSPIPEVHAWANRQNLASINLCSLEEYVVANLKGGDLSHCLKKQVITGNGKLGSGDKPNASVSLPDLTGMSLKDAVAALEAVGLSALPELGANARKAEDAGTVEVAFPEKEGTVHAGDQIIVRVFDEAVASSSVPGVVGMQLPEASAAMKKAGLEPVFELGDETDDPQKDGTVARQAPAAGTEIEAGREVRLIVYSLSVPAIVVPNLSGMGLAEAKALLSSRGLSINPYLKEEAAIKSDVGKVYKQYPEPGREILENTGVDVWVYDELTGIVVPALQGMRLGEAKSALDQKGLIINPYLEKAAPSSSWSGKVYRQSISSGSKVENGSSIKVWVYDEYEAPKKEVKTTQTVVTKTESPSSPVLVTKNNSSQTMFILDRVVFSKYKEPSDLCGDDMTCKSVKKRSSSHLLEHHYSIGKGRAEFQFKDTYEPSGDVISNYRATFTFNSPPSRIYEGDILHLNASATASGYTKGWHFNRSFHYYIKKSGRNNYFKKTSVAVSNRELPFNGKLFSGNLSKKSTTKIIIPKISKNTKELVIGGKHGWDPGIYIDWVYRKVENKISEPIPKGNSEIVKSDKNGDKTVPYIDIPSTLFSYRFERDKVYVGGKRSSFMGGRIQRPTDGFLVKGTRMIVINYDPEWDEASRTNQMLKIWFEWIEVGDVRTGFVNSRSDWCSSGDRDIKVIREGRKEFTISLNGYKKRAVKVTIRGYMRPSLLNSNTIAEANRLIKQIYSQIAPYAAKCP